MELFLGVDVGGSKTHALIMDNQGNLIGFGEAGGGNPEMVGYDGLVLVLRQSVKLALMAAGAQVNQIVSGAFGIAGYDWPVQLNDMQIAVDSLGLSAKIKIVNDAALGLFVGAPRGWGIVASAGTGNNVWGGRPDGREGRITGNSARFGEYGGASELVSVAIQRVAHMWTQRGPHTDLGDVFLFQTGARNIEELLEGLVEKRYHLGAEHAPLVIKTAQAGDVVAMDVIRWSVNELAESVLAVARQLDLVQEAFDVVLSGSLFRQSELFRWEFEKSIKTKIPAVSTYLLEANPVGGAVLLAKQEYDGVVFSIREHVLNQMEAHTVERKEQ